MIFFNYSNHFINLSKTQQNELPHVDNTQPHATPIPGSQYTDPFEDLSLMAEDFEAKELKGVRKSLHQAITAVSTGEKTHEFVDIFSAEEKEWLKNHAEPINQIATFIFNNSWIRGRQIRNLKNFIQEDGYIHAFISQKKRDLLRHFETEIHCARWYFEDSNRTQEIQEICSLSSDPLSYEETKQGIGNILSKALSYYQEDGKNRELGEHEKSELARLQNNLDKYNKCPNEPVLITYDKNTRNRFVIILNKIVGLFEKTSDRKIDEFILVDNLKNNHARDIHRDVEGLSEAHLRMNISFSNSTKPYSTEFFPNLQSTPKDSDNLDPSILQGMQTLNLAEPHLCIFNEGTYHRGSAVKPGTARTTMVMHTDISLSHLAKS